MAKRGPHPQPDHMKMLKGTFQPCRSSPPVVESLDGVVVAPKWLKGQALKLWRGKVEIYERRGQSVVGCESALAQYCAVEADLIQRWKKRTDVPVALITAHRVYANEFYDTPASQQAGGKKTGASNRFATNGQQPIRVAQ